MMPGIWTKWSFELPPHDVEFEASYGDPPEQVIAGTRCKGGCCFRPSSHGMNCITPVWWRIPASPEGKRDE